MRFHKNTAMWGTYGKGGVEHCNGTCPLHQLEWKKLVDCYTEHLQAILRTQPQIVGHEYTDIIHSILADRGVKPKKFSFKAAQELNWKIHLALRARANESKTN